MSAEAPWRFSESRPIRPFRVSETALANSGFRTRDDVPFSTRDPWNLTVEPEEIASDTFRPRLRLEVDHEKLESDTGLVPSDLQISIIARDPAVWRAERIARWPLLEYPEEHQVPEHVLHSFSGARGLEFAVQITPLKKLEAGFRRATSPGHIVAGRVFHISVPSDGSDFPVELVDPSVFVERQLPERTVWIVNWHTESDFDLPAEDVLTVLVNKEYGEKLLRLSSSDTVGSVLWAEIAVEILVEIALVILRSEPSEPQNKEGLLGKILARMARETGMSRDTLIAKASDRVAGASFIRAHLQVGLELAQRIGRISLAGRS